MIEFISLPFAMIVTALVLPFWIKRASEHGLVSKDMHKKNKNAANLGGLGIIAGFLAGSFLFVGYDVFTQASLSFGYLFAAVCSVLIAAILGMTDDILGWKIGLKQWHKVLLSLSVALPIMVLNAGVSVMHLPYVVDIGLLFPLVVVPVAIVGAANGFNMMGGFNGLEAGMGILILSTLGWFSYTREYMVAAVLAFSMVGALIAFLAYNWYPAQIFPGNTMTYAVGALIGITAILGNIEKLGAILFIPYFIQFILKTKGFMQKESFGRLKGDGTLTNRYKKWYGLEHVAIAFLEKTRCKVTEKKVVLSLLFLELLFVVIAFLSFYARTF